VGILNVHYLITDIVGCLNKVNQRMADVTKPTPIPRENVACRRDAKLVGYLLIGGCLRGKEAEFLLAYLLYA
jgi:hypothetical protein